MGHLPAQPGGGRRRELGASCPLFQHFLPRIAEEQGVVDCLWDEAWAADLLANLWQSRPFATKGLSL
eukprot:10594409-Lingulodinium_polyedra.AAC.1